MRKILKIIGIVFIIIIGLIILLFVYASFKPAVPKQYWKNIKSDSPIEVKYNQLGSYEVEKRNMKRQMMKEIKMIIAMLFGVQKKKELIHW